MLERLGSRVGRLLKIEIDWPLYDESFLHGLICNLFPRVERPHKSDPAHEIYDIRGWDPKTGEEFFIVVKKKPRKEDIGQLVKFSDFAKQHRKEKARYLYIYVEEPTISFKDEINKPQYKPIEFLDWYGLIELFLERDEGSVVFLLLQNMELTKEIVQFFHELYKVRNSQIDANKIMEERLEIIRHLWELKDGTLKLRTYLDTLWEIIDERPELGDSIDLLVFLIEKLDDYVHMRVFDLGMFVGGYRYLFKNFPYVGALLWKWGRERTWWCHLIDGLEGVIMGRGEKGISSYAERERFIRDVIIGDPETFSGKVHIAVKRAFRNLCRAIESIDAALDGIFREIYGEGYVLSMSH